jgi:hypothetical protein
MNRRGFLQGLGAMISGIAIEKAIPFNRVWSFPKEIVIPKKYIHLTYALGTKVSWELIEDDFYKTICSQPKYVLIPPELKPLAENILYG